MNEQIVFDRRLYLTADRKRVVEEGDPTARYLWVAKGHTQLRSEVEKFGVSVVAPEAKQAVQTTARQAVPAKAR